MKATAIYSRANIFGVILSSLFVFLSILFLFTSPTDGFLFPAIATLPASIVLSFLVDVICKPFEFSYSTRNYFEYTLDLIVGILFYYCVGVACSYFFKRNDRGK